MLTKTLIYRPLKPFPMKVRSWVLGTEALAKTLGHDVILIAVRNLRERVIGKSKKECLVV